MAEVVGKLGRRVELDGKAPGVGDDLLWFHGRAVTPASSL